MLRISLLTMALLAYATTSAVAVDLESFLFNDANGTPLTGTVNTANPGNSWSYDEEATVPGDESTGDISDVQSGAYRVITDSAFAGGIESRFLDITNVASGTVYLSATISSWNFSAYDGSTTEQFRFSFLDNDTGTSGSSVTAQMQIRRNADTGSMELFGDAIGTAGSLDIANTVDLPDTNNTPFTMVLALDKDTDSFEVFYKDGANPTQVLGLGGVSRVRDGNSIRMVTNNFGVENFLPFVTTEQVNVDSVVLSDTNPFTDLITLEVDRVTGAMTLTNTSGAVVSNIDSVTLESAFGAIDLTDFTDFSGSLGVGQSVVLDSMPGGDPGLWIRSPFEDVRAELVISGGDARTVDVNFVGRGGEKWLEGDFNFNGVIDAGDYEILTQNAESDLQGLTLVEQYYLGDINNDGFNNVIDFAEFKDAFIAANGATAFANLIAGVPEPGTGVLAFCGALLIGSRRRRAGRTTNHESLATRTCSTMRTPTLRTGLTALVAFVLATSAATRESEAIDFAEYLFNDAAETPLTSVVNAVDPAVFFDSDTDTADVATNGLGQLNASLKANTGFGTNYFDIEPEITSGIIYGVMELTWDFQSALDTAENEEVRLSFVNADPRSTAITSEFRITRNDSDDLVFEGRAGGLTQTEFHTGQTLLNGGSLTQSDKFVAVVAADIDNESYEVFFSNNEGASFQSGGSAPFPTGRIIESVRLTLNNDLSNDNILIDRILITDDFDVTIAPPLPTKLALYVHPKSGHTSIVNPTTGLEFDIDYYRILSGDDSLIESGWKSLEEQGIDAVDGPDGGATEGDGVGETWAEAGGSDDGVLSESFLLSSSLVQEDEVLALGQVFDLAGDTEMLTFEYRDPVTGNITEGDVILGELLPGDYNNDGKVDARDYTVWRDNTTGLFTSGPGTLDYTTWSNNFGEVFDASPSLSTSIPEPASLLLFSTSIAALFRRLR